MSSWTNNSNAVAGITARFRYLSNFTAASRGFHCDSNTFELNNSIGQGKITVLKYLFFAFNFITWLTLSAL